MSTTCFRVGGPESGKKSFRTNDKQKALSLSPNHYESAEQPVDKNLPGQLQGNRKVRRLVEPPTCAAIREDYMSEGLAVYFPFEEARAKMGSLDLMTS